MKNKRWVVGFLVIALALMAIPVGFAAAENDRVKDFDALHQQMLAIHKQMLQKHVEYGDMTPEQAAAMEKRMTERYEYMKKNEFKPGGGHGFGPGMGHMGAGKMGRPGGGCCGGANAPQQQPTLQ